MKALNISFVKTPQRRELVRKYKHHLEMNHPIHDYLKNLTISELKATATKIKTNFSNSSERMRKIIASYFFRNHPDSPLASLKKCQSEEVEISTNETCKKEISKTNPIVSFLKEIPDTEVADWILKLGKKNLRNHDSMRKWIAQFFFEFNENSPLDSLIKFMSGDLPNFLR